MSNARRRTQLSLAHLPASFDGIVSFPQCSIALEIVQRFNFYTHISITSEIALETGSTFLHEFGALDAAPDRVLVLQVRLRRKRFVQP